MSVYSIAQAKDQLSRLVDEALAGTPVTITRHGKAVVTLVPAVAAPKPITPEYLGEMRRKRNARAALGEDAVTLVRRMRDEDP